ncbi:hypothetical protein GLOIN_2v1772930 [Rhizophagus clarus]|uniref:FAR1 domain-containing protein n=1 Tax=Rhizophagus clarus TaxID=94130 RepID=A0A8H3QLB6_9GLOM|nr:hypothetical protein GLOIN_2v1772930 [Rhizophagus clarus]
MSDSSDDEFFDNNFFEKVRLSFFTWKVAFQHIKQWAHQPGFFVRKGRSEKVRSKRKKQTIVCQYEGVPNVTLNNPFPIRNPIIRRPKGRTPSTARFKGPLQTLTRSNKISTS